MEIMLNLIFGKVAEALLHPQCKSSPRVTLRLTYDAEQQLDLDQRVQGSSPCAPINFFNKLGGIFGRVLPKNRFLGNKGAATSICVAL